MGSKSSGLKFAIIGHQDSWAKIVKFVNSIRAEENNAALTEDTIKELFGYFPPNKLFEIHVKSALIGQVDGFYIETFISPDELQPKYLWKNIKKVKEACKKAVALGADIVSLGGFTSIVLEANSENISYLENTAFTTGNTLTAAFVVDSIEKAAKKWHKPLEHSNLLVIGSTGDIGMACVNYFSNKVKELFLTARRPGLLKKQKSELKNKGVICLASNDAEKLLPKADIIICVASSLIPQNYLDLVPESAIFCDAGYPNNLQRTEALKNRHFYVGGMGLIKHGYHFTPYNYKSMLYDFPIDNISHGCVLESIVLAMNKKAIPYSKGRGNISLTAMKTIFEMAAQHEVIPSPFFNFKQ